MNKKIFIPVGLGVLIIIFIISKVIGEGKIVINCDRVTSVQSIPDSIELNVFVENSGSMDGYMCSGSNLKDAVYDYLSNLKELTTTNNLYYINSQLIPCNVTLDNYIKNLTPQSFAKAGGDRGNTDLREIIKKVMSCHSANTISVFISDCILDIPESATNYFGNCQVSIKNTFNEAIAKYPNLAVQISKLQSKFDGFWFCGHNKEKLSDVKRPYYIWVIGDKYILAMLNKKAPISKIIGGIQNSCAYSTSQLLSYDIDQKKYAINHSGKILVEVLVDLSGALQEDSVYENKEHYKLSNSQQVNMLAVRPINDIGSPYSHVINLELINPQNLKNVEIVFSYPQLAEWVALSNDSTGVYDYSVNKTTGILSLVKGVAGAYEEHLCYGKIDFNLKNK